MGLMDLDLKYKYDSDHDNMIADFYEPVLSESVKYYRLSGFFSSSVLATVARGMEKFIKNNGKMYLICSLLLPEEDIKILKETSKNPSKILEKNLINSLDDIEEKFINDHVKALGWMLANDKLEIKIAVVPDKGGMFHQKVGILKDKEGNGIAFSGSNNETATGLKYNVEDFKVFKNWDEGQKAYFKQDHDSFNKYWNNLSGRTKVYNLPDAISQKIIKIAPKNIEDLNLTNNYREKDIGKGYKENDIDENKEKIVLRDYQKEAISKWWDNGCKGIFEMATGTGKTYTALSCFKKLFSKNDHLITVIACPQQHLIDQWKKDVKKFYNGKIIIVSSQNSKWRSQIKNLINNFYLDIEKNVIFIITHQSLSSKDFIDSIQKFNTNIMLMVDEVHGIGSSKQLQSLHGHYNYRLGLSATPERWFDKEGTQAIISYFGGVVFEFNISDALNTINPSTGEFYLTPYIYKPIIISLNNEEYENYTHLSHKISNLINKKNKTFKDKKEKERLCFQRKNIVNNAEAKIIKLKEILDKNKDIKDLIIFCSPQQINIVQKILNEKNIAQHKFTHVEKIKKDKKYGGLSEREYLIKKFKDGSYKALISMKCLDEGVDIPSARNAIIMSSTSNPREPVQRRGRILRTFSGKEEATIYDFLVFQNDGTELSEKLTQKEVRRYREFAVNAKNAYECINILRKYYIV
jgi:superfamily II DNA or RNA helicase